jgi:branched-chain amino acid transport system substrate-binding protein
MGNVRAKVAVALLALVALAGACASDDTTGSTDETTAADDTTGTTAAPEDLLGPVDAASGEPIRIGMIADGTTASTDNQVEFDAAEATVAYLNEHKAGLGGRPIELVTCDSQLDPALTTDCANQMVQEDVPVVYMGTHANQEQSYQVLSDAGVPMLWAATTLESVVTDRENSFVLFNTDVALIDLPLAVAEENDLDSVTVVLVDVPAARASYEPEPPAFEEAGVDLEVIPVAIGTADMTAPLQSLAGRSDTVAHIVAFDAFCISAFNAFGALGFTGPVSSNDLCITDATRTAIPGETLEGVSIAAGVPSGTADDSTAQYRAVMDEFGPDVDATQAAGATAFMVLSALDVGTADLAGEVTSDAIRDAMHAMPWTELPGSGGLHFRCNGNADPDRPALCVRGALQATLDAEGVAATYEPIGDTEIED